MTRRGFEAGISVAFERTRACEDDVLGLVV
jgi:hypothetical protein